MTLREGEGVPRRTEPELIIKPLGRIYAAADPYVLPLFRVVTGLWLVPHGIPKMFGGAEATAAFLEGAGYSPGIFWAWAIAIVEVIGGLMLAAGLLTRVVALAVFIFMINAVIFHAPNGFLWTDGGWEYPAMWAAAALIFLVRGGGHLSLDRALGREF